MLTSRLNNRSKSLFSFNFFLVLLALATCVARAQERVISLAPSITEIILELGKLDELVGVTVQCRFPQVQQLKKVGSYIDPSLEAIVALKPDLIIGLPEHATVLQKIEERGIKGLLVENQSLASISKSFDSIASALGVVEVGKKLQGELQQKIKSWKERALDSPVATLLLFGEGGIKQSFAAGSGTVYHEILNLCGGRNVVAGRRGYGLVASEELLLAQPAKIIVLTGHAAKQPASVQDRFYDELQRMALRDTHVDVLAGDYWTRPGIGLGMMIDDLCQVLRKER